jgi:hypothetical protein
MKTKFFLIAIAVFTLAACTPAATAEAPAAEEPADAAQVEATAPPPTATTPPTATPEPTATPVPPTPTEVPPTPTETPIPPPIVIGTETAADGCTLLELNPVAWSPLYRAYNPGSDPFFHIHTKDPGFFFGMELYTVYGAGWTGQLGTFETDCTANGICVYVAPSPPGPYLADAGEIEIVALSQVDGVVQLPIELILRNLTFQPVPGGGATGCYHVDEVIITIAAEE